MATRKKDDKKSSSRSSSSRSSSKSRSSSGVTLDKAETMRAAQVAPVTTYQAPTVGTARDLSLRDTGPATLMQRTAIDRTQEQQARNQQLAFGQALERQMRGEGPSLAGLQMQEGTNRAIQQQAGAIAAMRLRNPAQAARLAVTQGAQMQQQANLDAAKLRMGEALAAQQQYGEFANQLRGADAAIAAQQASLDQSTEAANQQALNQRAQFVTENQLKADAANQTTEAQRMQYQAQLAAQAASEGAQAANQRSSTQAQLEQQAAANNQAAANQRNIAQGEITSGVERARIGGAATTAAAQASAYGNITAEQIRTDGANYRSDSGLAAGVAGGVTDDNIKYDDNNRGAQGEAVDRTGNAMAAAAEAGMKSDERSKKNIKPADKEIDETLSRLRPSRFEYKDSADGKGPRFGVMAQDMEKSKAGKEVVSEDEDGTKMLDWKKSMGLMLAAQARLSERLDKIEGRGKK